MKLLAVIIVIVGVFAAFIAPLAGSIRQGLDLQGGTHVVLEGVDTEQAQVNDDAMNRVVKIMEKRVNELGLTEPIIQREGERRIIIELPGVKDPDKAIAILGKTAISSPFSGSSSCGKFVPSVNIFSLRASSSACASSDVCSDEDEA